MEAGLRFAMVLFLDLAVGMGEHTPGAKPLLFCWIERPKAEALGYLEATTDEWVLKSSVIEYGWPLEWVAL